MNKMKFGAALMAAMMLAGCSGATTSVSDADEKLMTIGDVSVDKGQVYTFMKNSQGGNLTLSLVEQAIYDKEVPADDEIRKEAEDTYNEYAKDGDLSEYLQSMGYKDKDDYIDKVLVPSIQADKLLDKWFDDDKDAIIKEYKPSKAQIVQTDSEDNAKKALDALKDGKNPEEVYDQYGLESSTYNGSSALVTTMDTSLPTRLVNTLGNTESKPGVVNEVFSDDSNTQFFVAVLVDNDYDTIKSDLIQTLKNDSTVSDKCVIYYLKKYDFQVYDQDIFDQLKINSPQYLVQRPDLAEDDSSDN